MLNKYKINPREKYSHNAGYLFSPFFPLLLNNYDY